VIQRNPAKTQNLGLLALALLILLAGCGRSWEATVIAPDGSDFVTDGKVLKDLAEFAEEEQGVPLERVLWAAGYQVVERLVAVEPKGERHEFEWPAVASDAWWRDDGQIAIGAEVFPVSHIEVEPPVLLNSVEADITDLAPTVAAALGLTAPAQATGQALEAPITNQVLLLFLDGLGYLRYTKARDAGLVPNLAALGEPLVGLTVYPPSTSVASAALLTGAAPGVSGVDRRGIRKTEVETIFDVAQAAGLRVAAVEGEALAFNLRNAEIQLSGDRDGNGSTDDNVLANTLAVLNEGMPDLLYVHFHGIDDAGHTYGPGTPEEETAIFGVDAAVGQLLTELPAGTFIIIFADHGMHQVEEKGRLGNHGNLIGRDMFIPIWAVTK
jgi:predicted AlkP superfamily pyrophosphatase or phosphodiesterase